jgi:cytidine deaminase
LDFIDVTEQERGLVRLAGNLIQKRRSKRSSVGAALITSSGRIFQGVNIDIESSAPCSICAEYAAIGTMVSEGEQVIDAIVAVNYKGQTIPPCGRCRHFISEFGNPYVIVETDGGLKKSRLSDLYPLPAS